MFRAAAGYLGRPHPRCPVHGVLHTGKLARLIPLELALLDANGDAGHWERAVERAVEVAGRLAPDPEHGALVYFPGRLDPRNCSSSAIDSGECTDALARLLLHPRAGTLPGATRTRLEEAVAGNAGTYLAGKVTATPIVNQRLWGAMGLASAARWRPEPVWIDAVAAAVASALAEQRPDGSWGYEPAAPAHGNHPGAADLTVYYHGRCLAFLLHILDALPGLASPALDESLQRGLAVLGVVTAPDGRKPLALEGKRWFWASRAEAGSNAYDLFALLRGGERYGPPGWRDLAARVWARLRLHQTPDGSVVAGDSPAVPDFVCPTFHTADLAWPARVWRELRDLAPVDFRAPPPAAGGGETRVASLPEAGVLRLENESAVVLVRTRKTARNSQWGGGIGGGTAVYVGDTATGRDRLGAGREGAETAGAFLLLPTRPGALKRTMRAARRYRASDPPGREGRQWLFVARLLLAQGRPLAAATRLWEGYGVPFLRQLADPAATHWATGATVEPLPDGRVRVLAQPARPGGDVPHWAAGVTLQRELALDGPRLHVLDRLALEEDGGAGAAVGSVSYLLPQSAGEVQVAASGPVERRGPAGRRLRLRPSGGRFFLRVGYSV